ncbi:hypothetical protein MG293_012152 [Ovis ammon polii]|uniref:Uncharacterized protein n=1 Tax=Ovis ammon polii TaxID=230172 RepID=A0AAD4U3T7_OVIAM|nr:hypothetical protein MG293_012152 [Ovis ammon polii]
MGNTPQPPMQTELASVPPSETAQSRTPTPRTSFPEPALCSGQAFLLALIHSELYFVFPSAGAAAIAECEGYVGGRGFTLQAGPLATASSGPERSKGHRECCPQCEDGEDFCSSSGPHCHLSDRHRLEQPALLRPALFAGGWTGEEVLSLGLEGHHAHPFCCGLGEAKAMT